KLALSQNNCKNMFSDVWTLILLLQNIIAYQKLSSWTSNTMFYFAIEHGNLDAAVRMMKIIDCQESWVRQVQQALKQGNHKVCTPLWCCPDISLSE
ncbi:hypothetical protein PILCRDRAFT_78430, partial [Piloderma croceum F 1598]